jgi:hypothetical protein
MNPTVMSPRRSVTLEVPVFRHWRAMVWARDAAAMPGSVQAKDTTLRPGAGVKVTRPGGTVSVPATDVSVSRKATGPPVMTALTLTVMPPAEITEAVRPGTLE